MKRRDAVLALLALGAAPFPSMAQQQGKVWRLGILAPFSRSAGNPDSPFFRRMRELGYYRDKNFVVEGRYAESKYERLPQLAAELVEAKVDIIWSIATPAALAAQKTTRTIPVVFSGVSDPVSSGIVASLARPGANVTGIANLAADAASKNFELLHRVAPRMSKVAVLMNPGTATNLPALKLVQAAAQNLGVSVLAVEARSVAEIENGFSVMAQQGAGSVLIAPDVLFWERRRQIAELAAQNRLPTIGLEPDFAEAGGLLSYGANPADMVRLAAEYVDKILKGAKPADLPVQQPTTFTLVVNMKTAKAIGVTIPPELLLRADRVVE